MILSFLFFGFIAYLVYRLVTDFVIPIYKTAKQVKQKFREMNEQMQGKGPKPGPASQNTDATPQKKKAGTVGDYIDFEEVKD